MGFRVSPETQNKCRLIQNGKHSMFDGESKNKFTNHRNGNTSPKTMINDRTPNNVRLSFNFFKIKIKFFIFKPKINSNWNTFKPYLIVSFLCHWKRCAIMVGFQIKLLGSRYNTVNMYACKAQENSRNSWISFL